MMNFAPTLSSLLLLFNVAFASNIGDVSFLDQGEELGFFDSMEGEELSFFDQMEELDRLDHAQAQDLSETEGSNIEAERDLQGFYFDYYPTGKKGGKKGASKGKGKGKGYLPPFPNDYYHHSPVHPPSPGPNCYKVPYEIPGGKKGSQTIWKWYCPSPSPSPFPTISQESGIQCFDSTECAPGQSCFAFQCVTEGSLRMSLAWQGQSDLNIVVVTPDFEVISVENPGPTVSTGTFDPVTGDQAGSPFNAFVYVESVFFTTDSPTLGQYAVVADYEGPPVDTDTPFLIEIYRNGFLETTFTGMFFAGSADQQQVYYFTLTA